MLIVASNWMTRSCSKCLERIYLWGKVRVFNVLNMFLIFLFVRKTRILTYFIVGEDVRNSYGMM